MCAVLLTSGVHVCCAASCRGEVPQKVPGVEGLASSAEPHQDEGLVPVVRDEAVVGLLSNGKDVRRHVLPTATMEHLKYLERARKWDR